MILPTEKRRELLARLAAAGPSTKEELAAGLSWSVAHVVAALRALELSGEVRARWTVARGGEREETWAPTAS